MCNCRKVRSGSSAAGGKRLSGAASGKTVKLRYLGDSGEILEFEGVITRAWYRVGGHINVVEVDTADLSSGESWAPGLLQLTGKGGAKLFEIHVPLKEEIEAEARARAMEKEAWAAAEALALPPEEVPDGESAISSD